MIMPPRTRLDLAVDSKEFCQLYDVYFNGIKQKDCIEADVDRSYIIRYQRYLGAIVYRNNQPLTKKLHGKVQIVSAGEVPQ